MTKAEEALSKAKMKLILRGSRFLSSVAIQLRHEITNDISIPTAATNYKRVLYNEDFFMSCSEEGRIAVIAHEVWHVAFMHDLRMGNRHPMIWNYAADYVINPLLKDDGFKLPEPHLFDERFRNMSSEEVYEVIKEEMPPPQEPPPGFGGDICDSGSEGEEEGGKSQEQKEREIQEILVKAATQARMENQAGSIPGEISAAIEELINPKLSWRDLLSRFVNNTTKEDYSFRRPNRRYLPHILPTAHSENIDHIAVAIDTSGSVSLEMLQEMLTEIQSINDTFKPKKMTILDCDTRINHIYEITEELNILDLEFTGGGGTSFLPVMKWAEEADPTVLLYFTDLYARQITKEDGYQFPCMWICYSDTDPAPWGETIYYELSA